MMAGQSVGSHGSLFTSVSMHYFTPQSKLKRSENVASYNLKTKTKKTKKKVLLRDSNSDSNRGAPAAVAFTMYPSSPSYHREDQRHLQLV